MKANEVSLIIVFHKKQEYLIRTLRGIEAGSSLPEEIILIEMDTCKTELPRSTLNIRHFLIKIKRTEYLPVAEARNLGAFWSNNNNVLVFLDADCIPANNYISSIVTSDLSDDNLYIGMPRYLTKKGMDLRDDQLEKSCVKHPLKTYCKSTKTISDCKKIEGSTFFLTHKTFSEIDGFDSFYCDCGIEEIDFAFKAKEKEVALLVTPYAVYHQQHPFCNPPLDYMSGMVINCNYFYKKWGFWPMKNHLDEFANRKLVLWHNNQTDPIEILRVPSKDEVNQSLVYNQPYAEAIVNS